MLVTELLVFKVLVSESVNRSIDVESTLQHFV